jgi:hypothetical protein
MSRSLALCCLCLLLGCDDGNTTVTSATAGDASTGPETSTGTSDGTTTTPVTTGDDTTGGAPDPVDLECTDPAWIYDKAGYFDVWNLDFAGDGHLRVPSHLNGDIYQVLDLAPDGALAGSFDIDTSNGGVRWGGVDLAGDVVVEYSEDFGKQIWLRKYTAAGALSWEVDVDALIGYVSLIPAVAPDGSVVLSNETAIIKFAPDGAVAWQRPNFDPDLLWVYDLNAAGAMVSTVPATTRVQALAPDGAVLWERDWGDHGLADRRVFIDDSGAIVVGEQYKGLARFTPDGELAWERTEDELGVDLDQLATNAGGHIAILGLPVAQLGKPRVVHVAPDGTLAGTHDCADLTGRQLALDASGRAAIAGYQFDNGQYDWFVVAFD